MLLTGKFNIWNFSIIFSKIFILLYNCDSFLEQSKKRYKRIYRINLYLLILSAKCFIWKIYLKKLFILKFL